MTKFDAVCTLLDLETREEKLSFVSEFYNNLCTPTNLVKTSSQLVKKVRKTVSSKQKKTGKKAGRPRKVKATQESNV